MPKQRDLEWINAQFDLEDPVIYRWRIRRETGKPSRDGFHPGMMGCMPLFLAATLYSLLNIVGLLSSTLGVVLGMGMAVLFFLLYVALVALRVIARHLPPREGSRFRPHVLSDDLIYLLRGMVAACMLGALYYALGTDSPLNQGFSGGAGAGRVPWLGFFLDSLLNVVLLDTPDVFNLSVSGIQPTTTAARLLTVWVRLGLAAGVVEFSLLVLKVVRNREETFYGTVRAFWEHGQGSLFFASTFEACRDGVVQPAAPEKPVILEDFSMALLRRDRKRKNKTSGQA